MGITVHTSRIRDVYCFLSPGEELFEYQCRSVWSLPQIFHVSLWVTEKTRERKGVGDGYAEGDG